MVLFEQMRTKIGGMNRRKERVPCAHPSCYVLRATNTTGRALHPGRVPTMCQNTTMTMIHEGETMKQMFGGHMPRDSSAVKAGNACSKAQGQLPRRPRQRSNVPSP